MTVATNNNRKPTPRSTVCGNRIWASGLKPDQLHAVLALDDWYNSAKNHSCLDDFHREITLSPKTYDWFFAEFLSFLSFSRRQNITPEYEIAELAEGDCEDSLLIRYYKTITGQTFCLYVKSTAS